ncbi:MAG: hypothetical protein R3E08_06560 [Thiotrichaceae bacterium]
MRNTSFTPLEGGGTSRRLGSRKNLLLAAALLPLLMNSTAWAYTVTCTPATPTGSAAVATLTTGVAPAAPTTLQLSMGTIPPNTTTTAVCTLAVGTTDPLTISGITLPTGFKLATTLTFPINISATATCRPCNFATIVTTELHNSDERQTTDTTVSGVVGISSTEAGYTSANFPIAGVVATPATGTGNQRLRVFDTSTLSTYETTNQLYPACHPKLRHVV